MGKIYLPHMLEQQIRQNNDTNPIKTGFKKEVSSFFFVLVFRTKLLTTDYNIITILFLYIFYTILSHIMNKIEIQ